MSIRKYVSIFLMKISLKIHQDAFSDFAEYINQELQNIFNIPMFQDTSWAEGYEEEEKGEVINVHGKDVILPPNFYNSLLVNLGTFVNNDTTILIKRFSEFLKEQIDPEKDIDENLLDIQYFKKFLVKIAAKEKGFTLMKGSSDGKSKNTKKNSTKY